MNGVLAGKVIGIVGGSGYLGSDLARHLCGQNTVRVIDIRPPALSGHDGAVDYVECDVTDATRCRTALEGLDLVFHRAGRFGNLPSMRAPQQYDSANLAGTLNVLDACVHNRVRRVVFDSTEFVYGNQVKSPVTEAQRPAPCSIYGATKLACEATVRMYDTVHDLSTIILRYCRVRDAAKEDVITTLVRKLMRNEAIVLFDRGEPGISFMEIEDERRACTAAAASSIRNDVFNISSGESISLSEIVRVIKAALPESKSSIRFENAAIDPPSVEYQFGPIDFHTSIGKAEALLDWKPGRTIASSIRGTIENMLACEAR